MKEDSVASVARESSLALMLSRLLTQPVGPDGGNGAVLLEDLYCVKQARRRETGEDLLPYPGRGCPPGGLTLGKTSS